MGVLRRFERWLDRMVNGGFARALGFGPQPVAPSQLAVAVQCEMDDRAAVITKDRTLVPNDFVVELADSDYERMDVYLEILRVELFNLTREYAKERGYSFVGPVRMRFEQTPDMPTGSFRIRTGVIRNQAMEGGEIGRPASDVPRTHVPGLLGHPQEVTPIAKRLIAAAAGLLPAWERVRYVEEFRSELWEIAHAGGRRRTQLAYAARQVVSAWRLHAQLKSPRRRGAAP